MGRSEPGGSGGTDVGIARIASQQAWQQGHRAKCYYDNNVQALHRAFFQMAIVPMMHFLPWESRSASLAVRLSDFTPVDSSIRSTRTPYNPRQSHEGWLTQDVPKMRQTSALY